MQDRYTGDIGDFGKYGLLRHILDNSNIKLGVNWYLVPNEEHNADGKHIAYLLDEKNNHANYRSCDSALYDTLHNIVKPKRADKRTVVSYGARLVDKIEKSRILNLKKVFFYNKRLTFGINRCEWFKDSIVELKDSEVVFLDPDNGLEVSSCSKNSKKSVKYVQYDEALAYLSRGKSLIIYQHRDMKPKQEFYERFLTLSTKAKERHVKCHVFSIRFNRFSVREYVFVLQKRHSKIKELVVGGFMKSKWGEEKPPCRKPHFTFSSEF